MSRGRLTGWLAALLLSAVPHVSRAQTVEIAPFGGYRFGGDLYEAIAGMPLDVDGAPAFGATLDVFVASDTSVSFLYSHQETRIDVAWPPGATAERITLSVDHWHLGGTRELGAGPVRPLLGGSLGLTRYGHAHDSELRFSVAGGAGVKLMPTRHLGARLDGRVYAVFVDGDAAGSICGAGGCLIALDVSLSWQVEFTAGLVVSF